MANKNKRVIVTGGAGYIGNQTAHILRDRGYNPVLLDNLSTGSAELAKGFDLHQVDLADRPGLIRALRGADAVLHFAACAYVEESTQHPQKYFQNNVVNGISLLDALLETNVRKIVFSSSCAVYGTPSRLPITEDAPKRPVNPYGATKFSFELALQAYASAYGLRYAALRYFNAAGADEQGRTGEMHSPETHLIPCALEAAQGKRVLQVFGNNYPTRDGTCVRDYIHVTDLAEAHISALQYLEQNDSLSVNLGTGRGSTVREIIGGVERVTGKSVPFEIMPARRGDPAELTADASKARAMLGWQAARSLDQMISSAWEWSNRERARNASHAA